MKNIRKLETIVKEVMVKQEATRSDDFLLVASVCRLLCPGIMGETFIAVLNDHKKYGLPSFESITRARRKLQAEYKGLEATNRMKAVRAEAEEEFRNYAND